MLTPAPSQGASADQRETYARSLLEEPDSFASTAFSDFIDRAFHAWLGRLTGGLSPGGIASAVFDWSAHLALAPGKQMQLWHKAFKKTQRFQRFLAESALLSRDTPWAIDPLDHDKRFVGDEWQKLPFNMIAQAFLLQQQWWHAATTGVPGVSHDNERMVSFITRQLMDVFSPSNAPWLNPEVINTSWQQGGQNFMRGWQNILEDMDAIRNQRRPAYQNTYEPGKDVAITAGKVVFRNALAELIHYEPRQKNVAKEPILIVPAWIMKYYILDLEPDTSLVRYLVEQGHDVYILSWKNPNPEDRDVSLVDYMNDGVFAALDFINAPKTHLAGYCLGGTLAAIVSALMAREGDDRLASLTLLAGQVDFTEAGELTLFIGESQVDFLEDIMWEQGFLDTTQMAGAFQLLRSNDLIWSRLIREYLLGIRQPANALMAWNADATRMPFQMHSDYLREFFLKNSLASGHYAIKGKPISITDIRVPIFAVGTEKDHVAPWRSVYKIHLLSDTDVTFALASGGHNGGIVSPPGRKRAYYRIAKRLATDRYLDPDSWAQSATYEAGSWWPAWSDWLHSHSSGLHQPDGQINAVGTAPGAYVFAS
ncbi:MAG: alpha/beta fold hydrolase [Pseudomonadota bacterium]